MLCGHATSGLYVDSVMRFRAAPTGARGSVISPPDGRGSDDGEIRSRAGC